jgi:hypothetical protein
MRRADAVVGDGVSCARDRRESDEQGGELRGGVGHGHDESRYGTVRTVPWLGGS